MWIILNLTCGGVGGILSQTGTTTLSTWMGSRTESLTVTPSGLQSVGMYLPHSCPSVKDETLIIVSVSLSQMPGEHRLTPSPVELLKKQRRSPMAVTESDRLR